MVKEKSEKRQREFLHKRITTSGADFTDVTFFYVSKTVTSLGI
jgi:hypothetical protein